MDYRIEKLGAVRVAVKKERFSNGDLPHEGIKSLWERCRKDGTIKALCGALSPKPFGKALVGICFDCPGKADFDYAIGAACKEGPIPAGLCEEELPAGTWAAFPSVGPMPGAFQALWKRIYTEFFPASEYQPAGGMALEVYPGDDVLSEDYVCEIWISVEKKRA